MGDTVTLAKAKLTIKTEEGRKVVRSLELLEEMYRQEFQSVLRGSALPDGVKFIKHRGGVIIVVHEQKPQVRQLKWLRRKVRVSLPYTILVVALTLNGSQVQVAFPPMLYFSNTPLKDSQSVLCYPALLNISPYGLAGICLSRLPTGTDVTTVIDKLLNRIWNSGFNNGLGAAAYGLYTHNKRLSPIKNWEKNSKANKSFALKVGWKPAGTVGVVIEAMGKAARDVSTPTRNVVSRIIKFAKV